MSAMQCSSKHGLYLRLRVTICTAPFGTLAIPLNTVFVATTASRGK